MKILIVDDEVLARARLRKMLSEISADFELYEAENGISALESVNTGHPEIILLDIRMPGMDGLEVAQHIAALAQPPAIIFTTAYAEHSLVAFDINAVDYLLKPIRQTRLQQALNKATLMGRHQLDMIKNSLDDSVRSHLSATMQNRIHLVSVDDIYYLKAEHKYVIARHKNGKLLINESLQSLGEEFRKTFIRVHRNTLASIAYISTLEKTPEGHQICLVGIDEKIAMSRRQLATVKALISTLSKKR